MVNFTFMDRVWGNMTGTHRPFPINVRMSCPNGFFPLIIMHVYHDHIRSTIVNHGQPLRTPLPFFTRQHSNTMCWNQGAHGDVLVSSPDEAMVPFVWRISHLASSKRTPRTGTGVALSVLELKSRHRQLLRKRTCTGNRLHSNGKSPYLIFLEIYRTRMNQMIELAIFHGYVKLPGWFYLQTPRLSPGIRW